MSPPTLRKILLIEDDEDIRQVSQLVLESLGTFEVATSPSGRDGIEQARHFAPDLVLLDVMMPELDGPDTLRAMRADPQLSGIAVVFMTAKAQPDEIAEYRSIGALDVIVKPFDPMALCDTIQSIWGRHHAADRAT